MTSRLTVARGELVDAFTEVLPGRVGLYPPPKLARPYVWIGVEELSLRSAGSRTQLTVATFPVWIAYDGTQAAQVAGVEDLIAKVWDACLQVAAARPTGSYNTVSDVNGVASAAHVVTVEVTLGAFTLCLPDVAESAVPPAQIPVTT